MKSINFQFPPTISDNFFHSITSLLKPYVDAASAAWETLEKEYHLVSYIKDSYYLLYKKLVSVALLVQGYAAYNVCFLFLIINLVKFRCFRFFNFLIALINPNIFQALRAYCQENNDNICMPWLARFISIHKKVEVVYHMHSYL